MIHTIRRFLIVQAATFVVAPLWGLTVAARAPSDPHVARRSA